MSCHLVKRGGASVTFIAGLSGAVGSWPMVREVGFLFVKPPQSVMRERREDLVDHRNSFIVLAPIWPGVRSVWTQPGREDLSTCSLA